MRRILFGLILGTVFLSVVSYGDVEVVRNVIVYKEDGCFGGWPANNGIWSWDDEIVVGFIVGEFKQNRFGHAIDDRKPKVLRFARSLDGGETWTIETPTLDDGAIPTDCPGDIDFTQPDFALALRMVSSQEGYPRFYWSKDRCRSWEGPYKLPTYDRKGIAARTDYIINGPHDLMAFITASKDDGREGRPFCIRTTDGGKTWDFVSWIGPEPKGYAIMPSTVRLPNRELLTAIRCKEGRASWIDCYLSSDDGQNWHYVNRPAPSTGSGNPPSMIRLADGRLALTYGYRAAPYGIRARLSRDHGRTWGDEIVLRDDAGCWDLGYPRTVQRPDGKVVTVYYFNDAEEEERYIAATIWDAGDQAGKDMEEATVNQSARIRRLDQLESSEGRLLPDVFGEKRIAGGGLYLFKPGETAHPEPRHVHDVDEVFIFLQGKGVLPIDGVEYPVKTGDVVVVRAGEDHHTRSSEEDPLVAAWYLMEK